MEILIRPSAAEVAVTAADTLSAHIRRGAVLGLATGSTPVATYRELAARYRAGGLSFAGCRAFLLDEYIGLAPDHEQSYHRTIREEFTDHIDIDGAAVHSPEGMDPRPWEAADRYERAIIDAGGIDVQLLGIGTNGHIGFNEPASSLSSTTRIETLHPQTVVDNSRFFDSADEVPTHALTQGLATILRSRHAVLLATGEVKADAVRKLVEGPLTSAVPASVLQMHPRATIIVDEAAASLLAEVDYYRYIDENRPAWQGPDGQPVV